jgi:hypothetical protein
MHQLFSPSSTRKPTTHNPMWAICERIAEVQALLDDHVSGGKYTAADVIARRRRSCPSRRYSERCSMSATPRQTNENRKSARLVNIAQTTAGSRTNMNSNAAVFLKIRCGNERAKISHPKLH